jgi:hypothetical protein
MKRKLLIYLIACLAMVAQIIAQPKLKIEKGGFQDWGVVKPNNSPLNCEFKLYNTGNKTLKIVKLEPDCSCTTTPLDKEEIEPGSYATVKISVKLNDNTGEMRKRVKVITNIEGADSMQIINMKALVIPSITFFPKRVINFGAMEIGKTATTKIIMTNETDKDIKITELEVTKDLKISLSNNYVLKAKQDFEIIATVTPTASGNFSGIVSFKTSDPDMPYIKIFAYGNIMSGSPEENIEK